MTTLDLADGPKRELPDVFGSASAQRASGICGWVGDLGGDPRGIIAGMAHQSPYALGATNVAIAGGSAVHLAPGSRHADLAQGEGFIAAIDGYPSWTSTKLAARAAEHGHARTLIDAYHESGPHLFDNLRGAFTLCVLDTRSSSGLIAIDRMGEHALCYAELPGRGVAFGTTATAVSAHPAVGCQLSMQALFGFLCFDSVPAPLSIYESLRRLLPGQYAAISPTSVRSTHYWQMEYETDSASSRTPKVLRRRLLDSLHSEARRIIEDEENYNIGVFLSGGLDSTTVLGLATQYHKAPVPAFTIGFDIPEFDETEYAKISAQHYGAEHRIIHVSPADLVQAIPTAVRGFDEPFSNSSAIPTYICARAARETDIDVLLSGDGGDELFAGNKAYQRMLIFEIYQKIPGPLRDRIIEPIARYIPDDRAGWLLRKLKRYVDQASVPVSERSLPDKVGTITNGQQILNPDVASTLNPMHPYETVREIFGRTSSRDPLARLMYADLQLILADNDLKKVTRMCAQAGVRVRFPLLGDDVVRVAGSIPLRLQMKKFQLRSFYKEALKGFLPTPTLKKKKHGFGLPYGHWIKTDRRFRELVFDSIEALKARDLLNRAYIDQAVARQQTHDHRSLAGPLWDLMVLELWLQSNAHCAMLPRLAPTP